MSKKESVKTYISMLQALLVVFLTAYLGLLGYIIVNIDENFSTMQMIYGFMALCFISIALAVVIRKFLKMTKELEKMK